MPDNRIETKQELKTEEFIREYLIIRIGQLRKHFPFFAFTLIAIGIETLGSFLDSHPLQADSQSRTRFRECIQRLFPATYATLWERLYKSLRCGLAHVTSPKADLYLVGEGKPAHHLTEIQGVLVLVLEPFYEDFVKACTKIIDDNLIDPSKQGVKVVLEQLVVEESGGKLSSTSGTGDVNAISPL
jgi:hypothetical protein